MNEVFNSDTSIGKPLYDINEGKTTMYAMTRKLGMFLLILSICCSIFPRPVLANTNEQYCGDSITWELLEESDGSTLVISGFGDMYDYSPLNSSPWAEQSSSGNLKKIIFSNDSKITGIGAYSFADCYELQSVENFPQTVTKIGESSFCHCANWETNLVLSDNVEEIGQDAFNGCESLISVTLGRNIHAVPDGAFCDCDGIKSVRFRGELDHIDAAFGNCKSLESVVFDATVHEIQAQAFADCEKLSECYLPEGLSLIGTSSFEGCKALPESFYIPVTVSAIEEFAFHDSSVREFRFYGDAPSVNENSFDNATVSISYDGERSGWDTPLWAGFSAYPRDTESIIRTDKIGSNVIYVFNQETKTMYFIGSGEMKWMMREEAVPWIYEHWNGSIKKAVVCNGVTLLTSYAFARCGNLETVFLADSIKEIGEWAFLRCGSLDKIEVPDSVKRIGVRAFEQSGVQTVKLPNEMSELLSGVFYKCTQLESVTMPETIGSRIPDEAFYGCSKMKEITIPESVKTIEGYAFYGCRELVEIILPETITKIGKYAFYGCKGLNGIVIPETVTEIGESVFSGCSGLEEIDLKSCDIQGINDYTFFGCSELKTAILPDKTKRIGERAFYGCSKLNRVDIYSPTAPAVSNDSIPDTAEVHALYEATGYEEGNWPQYNPILDLLKPEENSIATLRSHTISLAGNIGINYYFYMSEEALNDEGAKVVFELPNNLTSEVPVREGIERTSGDKTYYIYSCNVHSTQMTGDIIAKVVLSDGRESEEFPYTVKEYADIIIKNKNNSEAFTKATPLVKSMLNYGGYAQVFFQYDHSPYANADLTEEERDVSGVKAEELEEYAAVKNGTTPNGISYKSSTLLLTSATAIRHNFTLEDGHDISEYTFRCGDQVLTPVKRTDNVYYVEIPNVASGDLDTMYTVTVGDFSIQYSAMTYVYNQLIKSDIGAALRELLQAMAIYNRRANDYFNT